MTPRKRTIWKLAARDLQLGERTLLMGIVNVTPDSFSDGGQFLDPDRAYAHALQLEEDGAAIIDIGAESTRPGSQRISEDDELRRLVPVLKRLRGKLSVPVSVDTYKAAVAERAIELGAEIINDPSNLTFDPNLAKVAADAGAGLVLNHMRGTPETWAKLAPVPDPMSLILADLQASANKARRAGVEVTRIVVDPGLGFGKRKEENSRVLAHLARMAGLDLPVMVGPSRKSFLAQQTAADTLMASAAAVTASILGGAHVVRVHDVAAMVAVIAVADAVVNAA
jgi:dihydropteroate synthase